MADYAARRRMMVDTQVRPSDVTKFPIIDAMLTVPRENFVPQSQREAAYAGEHVELSRDRVVMDPRVLAKLLDALNFEGDELVLDVGGGYGYSSAVVARLAQAVVMLEENDDVAREAQATLSDANADNVIVHQGALADGASEHGPYDMIVLQGGVERIPPALTDQLKDGGKIAAIFMEGALGVARIGLKSGGHITWRYSFNASAPVLPGFAKAPEFSL